MLKKFISREDSEETSEIHAEQNKIVEDEYDVDDLGISAAMTGLIETSDDRCEVEIQSKEETNKLESYHNDQAETWKDVKINPDLSVENKQNSRELLEEYQDNFSDVPTKTHLITHEIKLNTDDQVYCKPYKVSINMVRKVNEELKLMLSQGINERNTSAYASPTVITKKKHTDSLRLRTDYNRLNRITVVDPMPQPDVEDVLAKLGNS
jgi:hypothetical protein